RARAALALAQATKYIERAALDRQHVALLRLVAPDLHRRHARLVVGDGAQLEPAAAAAAVEQLRHRVRQAAGTDVMNRQDRIVRAQGATTIDDFLAAALHLGVGALH